MNDAYPLIHLTVSPWGGGGTLVEHVDVSYRLEGFRFAQGDKVFRINLETVTIPFCPMQGPRAADSLGELPLAAEDREAYPVRFREWRAMREAAGTVSLKFSVTPRQVPEGYRSSPYFDFRAEEGGANGAGITFLGEVPWDAPCRMRFCWELSLLPEGCRGASSHGDGDFELEGMPDLLTNAYYAVGQLRSSGDGLFGFYWFSRPPFDADALSAWTRRMYMRMAAFFHEEGKPYRIFVRRDPFAQSGGGTALLRSYMFGYSDAMRPSTDSLWNLLCHEMAHNWTRMKDEPYGECTWYQEGGAEFYSVMLPLRFGEITPESALGEIQRRTDQYYLNPFRSLSNLEAAGMSWKDRQSQRVPYGRGFFFLGNLDARIRRATGGKSSVDGVVFHLIEKGGEEGGCGNADFISAVKNLAGFDITEEFNRIAAGEHFGPDPDSFDGLFSCEPYEGTVNGGEDKAVSYRWRLRAEGSATK